MAGTVDERNAPDLGLMRLKRLPETLVRSPWLSAQHSLAYYLCGAWTTAAINLQPWVWAIKLLNTIRSSRCWGEQLIAIHWGAMQGARSFPWASKAWLGAQYAQLLRLGDRLYGSWAGQADFEKLGVSCERRLALATPNLLY